jgi:acyl-coenzyme A synthetase/AMP-(fatty) acid ligase
MGVRVSPEEVERSLLDSGLVREAAVFGQPHDLLGDEVWAAVVPRGDTPVSIASLSAYTRENMSTYMAPRRFLIKEAIPRTSTGKTCYQTLRQEAAEQPSASILKPRPSSRASGNPTT